LPNANKNKIEKIVFEDFDVAEKSQKQRKQQKNVFF
jgi:hypothetical protein